MLALTDHDTVAGCAEARQACETLGLVFVDGVELSCSWRGQAIHVIGLAPDITAPALQAQIADVLQRRRRRAAAIFERLQRRGRLPVQTLADALLAQDSVPTRTHIARALVAAGHATDMKEAFTRWLGRDRCGHVPVDWPALGDTLSCLVNAGAQLVLAHPHRYKLSSGALRHLVAEFKEGGGHALEISIGGMSPNDRERIATLARRNGLAGSGGSDFHDPATPWNPPGRFAKLPADIEPIAARLIAPGLFQASSPPPSRPEHAAAS